VLALRTTATIGTFARSHSNLAELGRHPYTCDAPARAGGRLIQSAMFRARLAFALTLLNPGFIRDVGTSAAVEGLVRGLPLARVARAAGLAATVAVAVAARLPQVFTVPFWEDEVASARILREPTLGTVIDRIGLTESTPPLWYALAWLVHLAGVPFREERLLSVAFGGLLAAAVVLLAERVVSRPAAFFAGAAVALGGEFVLHGHELRAYELVGLLACVFGLCLVRELERASRARELALAGCVAAGGSAHYFFVFLAAAALGWLWLDPAARTARLRATVAICGGGAVACVWVPLMLRQYGQNRFWFIGPFDARAVVAVPLRLFTTAGAGTLAGRVCSALFLVVLAIGAAGLIRSPIGRIVTVLAVAPLLEAAAAWLAGANTFDVRNLIEIGPFVAILAAAAIPRRVTVPVGAAAIATLGGALILAAPGPAYDAIARTLVRDGWSPAAPIAVYGDPTLYRAPLEWYLPRQPSLGLSRPVSDRCARVFLVRRTGRVTVLRPRLHPGTSRWLRHTTLLAQTGHTPACAQPLTPRHTAVS